jgi:hypothetical protein
MMDITRLEAVCWFCNGINLDNVDERLAYLSAEARMSARVALNRVTCPVCMGSGKTSRRDRVDYERTEAEVKAAREQGKK